MKANYYTGEKIYWWEANVHHNNCKQCRFNNGCSEKNKRNSDQCMKFKPKTSFKKKRSKK